MKKRTSPTASHFPSGLKDTHVAAFMRSRAVHVFDVEVSSKLDVSMLPEALTPKSFNVKDSLLRDSRNAILCSELICEDAALHVVTFGLARKNLCVICKLSSNCTTTAAAPAVYAKDLDGGWLSKAPVEQPMTRFRNSPVSIEDWFCRDLFDVLFCELRVRKAPADAEVVSFRAVLPEVFDAVGVCIPAIPI